MKIKKLHTILKRGDTMEKKYSDLDQLLQENPGSEKFFQRLPDFIQSGVREQSCNISTDRDLRSYAEILLRGDI